MKSKKCNHRSFWQIYRLINFDRIFSRPKGVTFKCELCHKKCHAKWKMHKDFEKHIGQRIVSYLLWFTPAFILIASVALHRMHFMVAIGLITGFHFVAMMFLIHSRKLKIKGDK